MELSVTSRAWLDAVLSDFGRFLQDHASCEKKASGMALSIASHYPDRTGLLHAMADLAVEELSHYREVLHLLSKRGLAPGADARDPYVRAMNQLIRRGPDHYLMDRLLSAAIIERRGSERFEMIADALNDEADKRLYRAIAASEVRHWQLFVRLAEENCDSTAVARRLPELIAAETRIVADLPLRPALH